MKQKLYTYLVGIIHNLAVASAGALLMKSSIDASLAGGNYAKTSIHFSNIAALGFVVCMIASAIIELVGKIRRK